MNAEKHARVLATSFIPIETFYFKPHLYVVGVVVRCSAQTGWYRGSRIASISVPL